MNNLKILGLNFDVKIVDNHNYGDLAMGRSDTKNQEINLIGKMKEETQLTCLLHESIHVISEKTGIELTESQVLCLESGIFDLIRSNKPFVNMILNLN